jgi:ATP-dependent protease ClpP protease subunit/ribosomal protein L12E/L44/L45/RPP1/RPP2
MLHRSLLALSVMAAIAAAAPAADEPPSPALSARSGLPPLLRVQALASGEVELLIYGFIGESIWVEGNSAKAIVQKLADIQSATIHVRINSEGGSVADGLAIYNALKRHPARIVVTVDGIAASIASLIACAGDEVNMPANTLMMLHSAWSYCAGNAAGLREQADLLDTFTASMAESYAAKTGKSVDDILALLNDGADHWYTARDAIDYGLADKMPDVEAPDFADEAAANALLDSLVSNTHLVASAPEPVAAQLRDRLCARLTDTAFASMSEARQQAIVAALGDETMKQKLLAVAIAAAAAAPAPGANSGAAAPAAAPTPAPAERESPLAALNNRNTAIRAAFAGFRDLQGVGELESSCLADASLTLEQVQAKLLAKVGAGATPLAGAGRVEAGTDEIERIRGAGVQMILARGGILTGQAADDARQGNPFANMSLIGMAEQSLIRAGVRTRDMTRDQIASAVLGQSTSDFPVLLETAMHKILLAGYRLTAFTWSRFCRTGTLSDYRPHNRYHLSSFSDLAGVTENGEYKNGTLGDGQKETITGARKGRILEVTPELLVNDDLGTLVSITTALGQAAGRTIEKDVYALLALNAGLGPAMNDGNTLFHASHGNIAATGGAPTVVLVDASRQQMAAQMDPGSNDYLDITPVAFLGPLSLGTTARVINSAQYDPDTANKLQKPNPMQNIFRDVIDTPRLSGTAWYMFADPNVEAVIEVAFPGRQPEPDDRAREELPHRRHGLEGLAPLRRRRRGLARREPQRRRLTVARRWGLPRRRDPERRDHLTATDHHFLRGKSK